MIGSVQILEKDDKYESGVYWLMEQATEPKSEKARESIITSTVEHLLAHSQLRDEKSQTACIIAVQK